MYIIYAIAGRKAKMICQKWLVKGAKTLMGVVYRPEKIRGTALLLPGFGMHMCDVDYFMSKLARKLSDAGMYTLLLDPYGHGDSYGELDECTIDSLKEDIMMGVEHCKTVSDNIYAISRGLLANLLVSADTYVNVIGLSPICIDKDLISDFILPKQSVEIYQYIPGKDYVGYTDFDKDKLCLMEMIGGRIRHIHGQFINPDILTYVLTCDHIQVLRQYENACWIFFEPSDERLFRMYQSSELEYRKLSAYYKTAIYRDAMCQYNVIDEIVNMTTA
jgi:hypothetical protein